MNVPEWVKKRGLASAFKAEMEFQTERGESEDQALMEAVYCCLEKILGENEAIPFLLRLADTVAHKRKISRKEAFTRVSKGEFVDAFLS